MLCCPHTPQMDCDCRKPAPGLLRRAREKYGVDLGQAILVGDSLADVQTASAVGIPAIMVLTGLGRIADLGSASVFCRVADDLAHATRLILNEEDLLPEKLYQQLAP